MDKYVSRKRRSDNDNCKIDLKCQKLSKNTENREEKSEVSEKKQACVHGSLPIQPLVSTDRNSVRKLQGENLDCDYYELYSRGEADLLLRRCEESLTYNSGHLAKVKVFGKWHDIPRKQVAHGDPGLSYTFSGATVPARPWTPFLEEIRARVTQATGYDYNFVLINRYQDGRDYMGEHKDDERDLVQGYPIASLSLGQPRDFVFRHGDSRGKHAKRSIPPVTVELQHGSLLLMKHPTNVYWYHSLPRRTRLHNVRINMTFRKMVAKHMPS